MAYELSLIDRLRGIHSALDDALGDSDVTHVEDDDEMRDRYPVQWAAEKLAAVICELVPPESAMEHIARDIRDGIFPRKSEQQ